MDWTIQGSNSAKGKTFFLDDTKPTKCTNFFV